MKNKLAAIVLQKQREIILLKNNISENPEHAIAKLLRGELLNTSSKSFKNALRQPSLAVIAEIKRKSPSNGPLAPIKNPTELAKKYVAGGASALSILTEEVFFDGKLSDLTEVATALRGDTTPILRKDFILDEIQIAESILAGANAILCIVAVTGKKTKLILDRAKSLNIDVLVEVIDRAELDIAIESGAEIIGVNNRNLKTFEVNPERSMELVSHIPNSIIKVAASGITTPEHAVKYYHAGFDAVLIGEALVKSTHPEQFIAACRHV